MEDACDGIRDNDATLPELYGDRITPTAACFKYESLMKKIPEKNRPILERIDANITRRKNRILRCNRDRY